MRASLDSSAAFSASTALMRASTFFIVSASPPLRSSAAQVEKSGSGRQRWGVGQAEGRTTRRARPGTHPCFGQRHAGQSTAAITPPAKPQAPACRRTRQLGRRGAGASARRNAAHALKDIELVGQRLPLLRQLRQRGVLLRQRGAGLVQLPLQLAHVRLVLGAKVAAAAARCRQKGRPEGTCAHQETQLGKPVGLALAGKGAQSTPILG